MQGVVGIQRQSEMQETGSTGKLSDGYCSHPLEEKS